MLNINMYYVHIHTFGIGSWFLVHWNQEKLVNVDTFMTPATSEAHAISSSIKVGFPV